MLGTKGAGMTNDEKISLIRKFKKICVRNWTSEQYQIPADSKQLAEIKAVEVGNFLAEALEDL